MSKCPKCGHEWEEEIKPAVLDKLPKFGEPMWRNIGTHCGEKVEERIIEK